MDDAPRPICSCLNLAVGPHFHPDNCCRQSASDQRVPAATQRRFCLGRPAHCPLLRAAWRPAPAGMRTLDRSGRPLPKNKAAGPRVWVRLQAMDGDNR